MNLPSKFSLVIMACTLGTMPLASAQDNVASPQNMAAQPWMKSNISAAERTQLVLKQMTQDEKLLLVVSYFGTDAPWKNFTRPVESHPQSAGFVYGVPRLGIPHIWLADAGLGVASQGGPNVRERTGLPSGMSAAATEIGSSHARRA